jgi:hypothetical protein
MPYYNPVFWVASDDHLDKKIEDQVILLKRATSNNARHIRGLLPPSALELLVVCPKTQEILRLIEWEDEIGRIFINLIQDSGLLRKGHFKTTWHNNPDGRGISPPHHIHFPTVKYSLAGSKTYAYPVKQGDNYLDALKKFCHDTNIVIDGVSIPLLRRWKS